MPVLYNNFALRPVTGVTLGKESQTLPDGRKVNTVVRATVRGTILPDVTDGSPTPVAGNAHLSTILAKQKSIRDIFSVDGGTFEVQGWDGSTPTKFQARVVSIEFQEGPWFNSCDYAVVLEDAEFSGEPSGNEYVETAGEAWGFSEDERPKFTKVTHTVSAKGRLVYDAVGAVPKLPVEYARDFVTNKLKLGWTSAEPSWSPTSGLGYAQVSANAPVSTLAWNHAVSEEVNEADGTYSATETWLLYPNNYFEEYTLSARKVTDQLNLSVVVSVRGVVHGLYEVQNDFDGRYANARSGWQAVKGLLRVRSSDAAGVTVNPHPAAQEVSYDPVNGTVSYDLEYNDRLIVSDAYEIYNVSKKVAEDDYKVTVSVEGSVVGLLYVDEEFDPTLRFTRAQNRWQAVKGLALSRAVAGSGVTDLKAFPVAADVSTDAAVGSVNYRFEFDDRDPENVKDDFSVASRYDRLEGKTTVTVEGTVTGYRSLHAGDPFEGGGTERYDNAVAYFNGKEPNLLGVAALHVGTDAVNPTPVTKSVGHNPLQGTVSYAYEFNSVPKPLTPGALSEVLTVTDENAVPVVAVIGVLGRAAGPVVQPIGTVTPKKRTVSLEVVFDPPSPTQPRYAAPPAVDVSQFAPSAPVVYLQEDNTSWRWTDSHLSRTVSWIFTG